MSSGSYRRTLLYVYHTSRTRAAAYGEASRFTSRMRCSLLLRKKGICGVAGCFKIGFVPPTPPPPPPMRPVNNPFSRGERACSVCADLEKSRSFHGRGILNMSSLLCCVCVRFVAQRQSPCTVVLVGWRYLQPILLPCP